MSMNNILMPVLCAMAMLASGCATTVPKSDSAALQGTWKGQEVSRRSEGTCSLTISGNAVEFIGADTNEWYKGTFILREDADPKQLVAAITECPMAQYQGKTTYAIYRLENGTLTLTGNEPGNPEVPASFDAPGARKFVFQKP